MTEQIESNIKNLEKQFIRPFGYNVLEGLSWLASHKLDLILLLMAVSVGGFFLYEDDVSVLPVGQFSFTILFWIGIAILVRIAVFSLVLGIKKFHSQKIPQDR